MAHKPCKRVGNNLEGTRYIFTLYLKDGSTENVTIQPRGTATHWWYKGFFGKIHEVGSAGAYGSLDSDPQKIMKEINKGGFILCDSGKGINGHHVILDKIECKSEYCLVPLEIKRAEMSDSFF